MKFSVVTPCLNAASLIEETIASVTAQSALRDGSAELQHIICDGGSTDGTLEIVRRMEQPHMRIVSRQDGGMYEALAHGLKLAGGDVLSYLNAGDYLHPHAFSVVRDVMSSRSECRWLSGYTVDYSETGAAVLFVLPYRYRRRLIRCGAYGPYLPFIQQESTFWRRDLMQQVDFDRLSRLRLAGDYYLWKCFAETADLHIVSAHLGGFRFHPGQLSEDLAAYASEMKSMAATPGPLDFALMLFDKLLWYAPPAVKKWANPRLLHRYDQRARRWD
jgi:glycosyltransferase involved in cell wall biosynthesis